MIIKKTIFYFLISIFIMISLLIGANKLYKYEEIKISKRSDTICALTRLAKIINRNYILKGTYASLKYLKTDIYNQSNKILCGNDIKKDSLGVLDAFGDRIIYRRISEDEAMVYSINVAMTVNGDLYDGFHALIMKSGVISLSYFKPEK